MRYHSDLDGRTCILIAHFYNRRTNKVFMQQSVIFFSTGRRVAGHIHQSFGDRKNSVTSSRGNCRRVEG